MPQTPFFVNTALVCFNCRKTAVVRLKESWREVTLVGDDTEVLDVVFVVCVTCLSYPHVHDPGRSLIPRYLEARLYTNQIQSLVDIFNCTPSIDEAPSFSVTSLKRKIFTRIYDTTDIFCISAIPEANIIVLENGCEIPRHCCFFRYEQREKRGEIVRYPELIDLKGGNAVDTMPFSSVAKRPPVLGIQPWKSETNKCCQCLYKLRLTTFCRLNYSLPSLDMGQAPAPTVRLR